MRIPSGWRHDATTAPACASAGKSAKASLTRRGSSGPRRGDMSLALLIAALVELTREICIYMANMHLD
jgi:hypothetical protein